MKITPWLLLFGGSIARQQESTARNPIRRVVTMLQEMQTKIESEQKKEEELYEKFVCYCKKNEGELSKTIEEATSRVPQLESQIEELSASKQQTDEELQAAKQDRQAAQQALDQAKKLRAKERTAYEQESGEMGQNLDALRKAVVAIAKGMGSAFLQSQRSQLLRNVLLSTPNISEVDRQVVTEFLSGRTYGPQSGEIVGILKTLADEMEKDLGGIVQTEDQAKAAFSELQTAKKREINAASQAIEEKTQRSGDLAVQVVQTKDDLDDTQKTLSEDEKFQVNLRLTCKKKEGDWAERQKMRGEEVQAIAETIKILNDDDALDLFKKTLPSPGVPALVQMTSNELRHEKAYRILKQASDMYRNINIDFIAFSLKGKKVDFSKVIFMIEDMVKVLGKEQVDDDAHKDYCNKEFDVSADKEGETQREVDSLSHQEEVAKGQSENLRNEIALLQDGIKELDANVQDATENRKKEHEEYQSAAADDQAALQLLDFAKKRLQKFYNPKLVPEEDATAFVQLARDEPESAPETWGNYKTKRHGGAGVVAMIDMLANELKKDRQEADHNEKDSQEEYEQLMSDSAKKRAADSKATTNKELSVAEADQEVERAKAGLRDQSAILQATREYIGNLHRSCDFLLDNYEFRKAARAEELDSLKKAKAVLRGADFSLMQKKGSGFLQ